MTKSWNIRLVARRIVLVVTCLGLLGCTSPTKPGIETRNRSAAFLLEAAYRSPNIATLCFTAQAPGSSKRHHLTLRMPMPDGVWAIPKSATARQIQWTPEKGSISWEKCVADGRPMEILEVEQGKNTEFPAGAREAIYVAYHEYMAVALGYVSAKPFFGEHHSYTVDLSGLIEQVDEKDDTFSYAKTAKKALKVAGDVGKTIGTVVVGIVVLPIYMVILSPTLLCGQSGVSCQNNRADTK